MAPAYSSRRHGLGRWLCERRRSQRQCREIIGFGERSACDLVRGITLYIPKQSQLYLIPHSLRVVPGCPSLVEGIRVADERPMLFVYIWSRHSSSNRQHSSIYPNPSRLRHFFSSRRYRSPSHSHQLLRAITLEKKDHSRNGSVLSRMLRRWPT